MALGFLVVHLKTQHGKKMGGRRHWGTTAPGGEPCTYNMAFPNAGGPRNFPVDGCWGRAETRTEMQVHFFHQHVRDTVVILGEGNLHHPRCSRRNMLVPWRALNERHISTTQCANGSERKRRRMLEEEMQ